MSREVILSGAPGGGQSPLKGSVERIAFDARQARDEAATARDEAVVSAAASIAAKESAIAASVDAGAFRQAVAVDRAKAEVARAVAEDAASRITGLTAVSGDATSYDPVTRVLTVERGQRGIPGTSAAVRVATAATAAALSAQYPADLIVVPQA